MRLRHLTLPALLASLCGCTSAVAPKVELYGMTLPRFEIFRYGIKDTSVPTEPYTLDANELSDIKAAFSAEFVDGRTLEFGPITARRQPSGSLVVCGLVNVRTPDGTRSGMTLFDGIASPTMIPGRIGFTPQRIAGANAKTIDIYSDCRDNGAL
ncbi:MAG: hypothetical protein H7Y08_09430 [Rhizobiaceae bacterium]|nr:hypothetical protein [Rhizobiaceae bacterium]